MATPHNTANPGEISKICLMPGDPLRAKLIVDTYFDNVTCFNTTRGMLGYTGTYKGHTLSVMGHGMGMPSIGIYSHELYTHYNVDAIIRIGSVGALQPQLQLGDILIAQGACTDSNYANQFKLPGTFSSIADFSLIRHAFAVAESRNVPVTVGNIVSSDAFYTPYPDDFEKWKSMGVLGVEMECAALYMNAAYLGKKAMGLVTVSDIIGDHTQLMTAEERQTKLFSMIEIGLETAVRLGE